MDEKLISIRALWFAGAFIWGVSAYLKAAAKKGFLEDANLVLLCSMLGAGVI